MTNRETFLRKLPLIILATQCSYFILFGLILQHPQFGNRPFFWDEGTYWDDAHAVAQHFDLATIRGVTRPVAALPALLLFRIFGLPATPHSVILGIFLQTLAFGSLGLWWLKQAIRSSTTAIALTASFLLSLKVTTALSNTFMIDVYTGAVVLALVGSAALTLARPGYANVGKLLAMTAVALHSKPVTFPVVAILIGITSLLLILGERSLFVWTSWQRSKTEFAVLAGASALLLTAVGALPTQLPKLFADLAYVNNTLDYWISQHGIWNGFLYLPLIMVEEMSLPQCALSMLTVGAALAFWLKPVKVTDRPRALGAPHILLAGVLMVLVVGVSFFLQTKDSRITYFLLPLSFAAICMIPRWPENSLRFACLTALLAVTNLLTQVSPAKSPWNLFATHLRLDENRTYAWPVDARSVNTYEQLGTEATFRTICADLSSRGFKPGARPISVYVPHSSERYNSALLWTYWQNQKSILRDCPDQLDFEFPTSTFRYGGWGLDGGVPKPLFTSDYIVVVVGDETGHLGGETEMYNKQVAAELGAAKPDFTDGLNLVGNIKNGAGQEVRILRRDKQPTYAAYQSVVEKLAANDHPNAWNIPYLISISKQSDLARRQIAAMRSDEFWEGVFYAPSMRGADKVYKAAVENNDTEAFSYPKVIERGS